MIITPDRISTYIDASPPLVQAVRYEGKNEDELVKLLSFDPAYNLVIHGNTPLLRQYVTVRRYVRDGVYLTWNLHMMMWLVVRIPHEVALHHTPEIYILKHDDFEGRFIDNDYDIKKGVKE